MTDTSEFKIREIKNSYLNGNKALKNVSYFDQCNRITFSHSVTIPRPDCMINLVVSIKLDIKMNFKHSHIVLIFLCVTAPLLG